MSRLSAREIEEIRRVKRAGADQAREEGLDVGLGQDTELGQPQRDTSLFTLLARESGLAELAWFLRYKIWAPVRRRLQVRDVAAELNQLDPRLLEDIGVQRALIDEVAENLIGEIEVPPRPVTGLVEGVQTWLVRQRTVQALSKLDDRMLQDVGIERSQIREVANRIRRPHFGGRPDSGIAAGAKASLRPLRQWDLSRRVANDMAHLDPEAMADLGYVKGDIDWVPEVLAKRKLAAS
jgi:uncharacterized protein YjiS (DUF1127 family)